MSYRALLLMQQHGPEWNKLCNKVVTLLRKLLQEGREMLPEEEWLLFWFRFQAVWKISWSSSFLELMRCWILKNKEFFLKSDQFYFKSLFTSTFWIWKRKFLFLRGIEKKSFRKYDVCKLNVCHFKHFGKLNTILQGKGVKKYQYGNSSLYFNLW